MRCRKVLAVALLALAAASIWGCADTSGDAPPPPDRRDKTQTLEAGIEELGGGRVLARGWVTYRDLEGGTWLLETQPPTSSVQHVTVIVIVPGEVTEQDFERLKGSFVGMEGTVSEGPSIRMAGRELVVDAVRMY